MRPSASASRAFIAIFCLWLCALSAAAQAPVAEEETWTGDWQTFWREGLATMRLQQDGASVTGTYSPGNGRIDGTVDNDVLRGTWQGPNAEGDFVFALSDDRESFTGRFGNGEYWNGARSGVRSAFPNRPMRRDTPRATLGSLLLRSNAAVYEGNAVALREAARILVYAEDPGAPDGSNQALRRQHLWDILNLATIRLNDAPLGPDEEDDVIATFPIGVLGSDETFDLTFRSSSFGWNLVVPPLPVLEEARTRFLDSLGYASKAEFQAANASSPREALFTFLGATGNWDEGGREAALGVMDLSAIPERLRGVEGELLADYLWAVINRIGYIQRQEIPNLRSQDEPFMFYHHPAGNVVIEPYTDPETEEVAWRFSAETMAVAPRLFQAMQALPVAAGLENVKPLSDFFVLREAIRDRAPQLLTRRAGLEMWQWIAFSTTVLLAWVAAAVARKVVPSAVAFVLRIRPGQAPDPARLARPVGAFAFLFVLLLTSTRLGLGQAGSGLVGRLLALAVVIAAAGVVFRLVGLVGAALSREAGTQRSGLDEIVTSLVIGLLKLVVVIAAIIFAADVVGLPYEGVLTGLGVGGVALAFAARDTVSNLLGGALLLADRPFKRDDLIDVDGTFAMIEQVGLRSTKLRTLDDALLVVPNSHLSDKTISNWGKRRKRRTVIVMGLTYDTPADLLDTFCKEVMKVYKAQTWTDDEAVFVGVDGFGASSIDIKLIGHYNVTAYDRQVEAQHALILDIVRLAERIGVSFAFPTRTVHVAPPERSAFDTEAAPPAPQEHAAQ